MSAEPVQTVAEAIGPSDGGGAATAAVDRFGDAAVKWFNPNTFAFKYLLSSCAATVAETATYPLDLTKTRLQLQGEHASVRHYGTPMTEAIPYRGMVRTAVGVVQEEGLLKLWQGVTPAIYRHIVYTGCRMGAYEYIRENLLHRHADGSFAVWKAAMAGMIAGMIGQFFASPTDLVKVQMQMEGRRVLEGKPPRVKSAFQAFANILKKGGVRGLWKGWIPNVQRAGLVNMGDLATYDTAKHLILKHTQLHDNWITHGLASGCSGLVAASVSTPADVIKTRVMNQPTDASGRGLLYRSSLDCLQKCVKNEGFWTLYKGFFPIWARMAPWSLTFWVSYEKIRHMTGMQSF